MDAEGINSIIDNIALKLKVPAEKLIETIPSFAIMNIAMLCLGIFLLFLAVVMIPVAIKIAKREEEYRRNTHWTNTLYLSDGIGWAIAPIAAVSLILIGMNLGSVVLWLYNPQAWAVKYILDIIK